jgi:hypothetical protein
MFSVYTLTPKGRYEWFGEAPALEDDERNKTPGAMRLAHRLREDIPEFPHVEPGTQAVVCSPDGKVVYTATPDNGFD